jgi:hypothetical protein
MLGITIATATLAPLLFTDLRFSAILSQSLNPQLWRIGRVRSMEHQNKQLGVHLLWLL